MSIVSTELIWRKPTEVSNTAGNGGRMTPTIAVSGVKNNILPDVPQAERTAGSTKYRKVFIHVANDSDLTLIAPKIFAMQPTPGDDRVLLFPGTQIDTQASITGTEQLYGAGTLNTNASIAATGCDVLVEAAADAIFKSGMTVRITDKQTIDGDGNEQYLVLSADATYAGNVATLAFTTTPLAYAFSTASPTYVSSCIVPGDIHATVSNWVETSGSGTYNEGTYPVLTDSIGSIEQTWTLAFTNATTYTITGNSVGLLSGSGTIGSNYAPVNASYSKPYFTIPAAAWGGTWANGNTIVFQTHPAAVPVWYKQIIPALAASLSGNKIIVGIDGESE